jgi:hypothetical protein
VVRVQTTEKAEEIIGFAQDRGWKVIVGRGPDQIEDLSDFRELMRTEAKSEVKPRLLPKICRLHPRTHSSPARTPTTRRWRRSSQASEATAASPTQVVARHRPVQ